MTLDLQEVIADWNAEPGEISARLIVGRDGGELLQMFPEGRPDGKRHHGLPTVLDYVEHEARLGRVQVAEEDARELQRELYQMNYRRLASSSLVEDCLMHKDVDNARRHVERALRDIDGCLRRIDVIERCGRSGGVVLRPTLTFHRGRLRVQRAILDDRYEDAIDEALRGRCALEEVLEEMGYEEEQRRSDPGVVFLHALAQRLRREYGIDLTLTERLNAAVAEEDYALAAELREELKRRAATRPKARPENETNP
ncbi:MAG TPA: hypothetical protein PLU99_04260 [Phycisphaerae bacterium]|nr:hypothetical protein [Phycisphaerae bacterium]